MFGQERRNGLRTLEELLGSLSKDESRSPLRREPIRTGSVNDVLFRRSIKASS